MDKREVSGEAPEKGLTKWEFLFTSKHTKRLNLGSTSTQDAPVDFRTRMRLRVMSSLGRQVRGGIRQYLRKENGDHNNQSRSAEQNCTENAGPGPALFCPPRLVEADGNKKR